MCGVPFVAGQQYLVFADPQDGLLETNICAGTNLARNALEELAFFRGAWQRPSPDGWIHGELTTRFGSGFGRVQIRFESASHTASTTLKGPGEFRVPIQPGTYRVRIKAPGGWTGSAWTGWGDTDEGLKMEDPRGCAELTVSLWPDGHVTGRVVASDGAPAPYQLLELRATRERDDEVGLMSHEVRTDKNGRFEFSGVEPRDYTLLSAHLPQSNVVRVLPSAHVRLTDLVLPGPLKFTVLAGTVFDSAGRPASKALVTVLDAQGWGIDTIRTDQSGRFNVSLLVGAHYQLESENHPAESTLPDEFLRVEDILAALNMSPIVLRLQRK